jgi:hypothetical protein
MAGQAHQDQGARSLRPRLTRISAFVAVIGLLIVLTASAAASLVPAGEPPTSSTSSTSTTTTTTVAPPTDTDSSVDLDADTIVFVAVVVGGLALLLFLPVLLSLWTSYRLQRNQQRFLEHLTRDGKLPEDDLKSVLQSFERVSTSAAQASGGSGVAGQSTTTSLLALGTLLLVGFALVIVLVSDVIDASELRKTIITALLSILASIGGFYFGARTAQVSAAQATGASIDGSSPTAPAFISATPPATAPKSTPYAYDFRATGSPAPTYALVGAPAWMSIDATTGTVSGIVPSDAQTFSFFVTATNSAGSASSGPFEVAVQ